MASPPHARFRKALDAIKFANRLAGAAAKRDEVVVEAVVKTSPEFREARPPRRPSAPVGVGRSGPHCPFPHYTEIDWACAMTAPIRIPVAAPAAERVVCGACAVIALSSCPRRWLLPSRVGVDAGGSCRRSRRLAALERAWLLALRHVVTTHACTRTCVHHCVLHARVGCVRGGHNCRPGLRRSPPSLLCEGCAFVARDLPFLSPTRSAAFPRCCSRVVARSKHRVPLRPRYIRHTDWCEVA
jgi:hypothetical protein